MDYETSGAQEWQLPGYGRAPAKKAAAVPTTQNKPIPTGPKNPGTPSRAVVATKETSPRPKTPGPASRTVVATKETQAVRGRANARGRTASNGAASGKPAGLFRDTPAKSKWRNGSKPGAVIPLPDTFGTFKQEFLNAARRSTFGTKTTTGQGRNEVFEDISKRTNAFVKPPMYNDRVIQIWGDPKQLSVAQDCIKTIISKCVSESKPKAGREWSKIRAHSVTKETNADFKEQGETILQELRKAPDPGTTFPEHFVFQWPKDGPSLHKCLGPELEALDSIRVRLGCHVFVSKDLPGYICALGNNHDGMKQIAGSIRTLWAEAVAKSSIKAKLYLVEPPQPDSIRAKIIVKKDSPLHKPVLRGKSLKGDGLEKWQDRMSLLQSKNKTRLLAGVENCLKGLSFVRGHLRMRVNLGTFVLENYQLPEDDKTWYGFEEFREMLLHEQSKGRLIPELKIGQPELLERCFGATDLLEPINKSSTNLKDAELAYSVNFEFLGADKSMLRLEAEFAKSPGAREYDIRERRWLRPRTGGQNRDHGPPLHVAVIDFGRTDWQLEIKSLEFHETSAIDTALKNFSNSIGFRRMEDEGDISANPKRKVTFPPDPPVSRIVEKSALRYRIRGTDYIFEIARYDEYKRTQFSVGQTGVMLPGSISEVPFTTWGASVFEANWDNLLGGHANLSSGQSAKYTPNLATFFPCKEASSALDDQAKGFWEFIDLVKKTADLLGPTRTPSEDADAEVSNSPKPAVPTVSSPTGMLNADLGTLF